MAKGPTKTVRIQGPKGTKNLQMRGTLQHIVNRVPASTTKIEVFSAKKTTALGAVEFNRVKGPAGQICLLGQGSKKPVCVPLDAGPKAKKKAKRAKTGMSEVAKAQLRAKRAQDALYRAQSRAYAPKQPKAPRKPRGVNVSIEAR